MLNKDTAISVNGLGKEYLIGQLDPYRTLRESLGRALSAPIRAMRRQKGEIVDPALMPPHRRETLWALKDVSFTVRKGEIVGVIGANGSGKSTLLKVLARITSPTKGTAEFRGQVGAMLEVGTGFHPELTGRENVFLNGAILGMKRGEIAARFASIAEFSGIERFLDTPVKRYSSGMYVRLAFAVAAHLDPQILLVDEVLAVGDAEFQRKCGDMIRSFPDRGRTVLLVSHSMQTVEQLCSQVIWLEAGQVAEIGAPGEIVPHYVGRSSLARH
jgi:lipopolysaccharide transport system ATP-binding protein